MIIERAPTTNNHRKSPNDKYLQKLEWHEQMKLLLQRENTPVFENPLRLHVSFRNPRTFARVFLETLVRLHFPF